MLNADTRTEDRYSLAGAYAAWRGSLTDTRTWADSLTSDVSEGYSPAVVAALLRDAIPAESA